MYYKLYFTIRLKAAKLVLSMECLLLSNKRNEPLGIKILHIPSEIAMDSRRNVAMHLLGFQTLHDN